VKLTHVGLVFERELTVIASAMEMGGPLPVERAIRRPAFFRRAEPLESFLYDGRVLSVVIRVHLHVGRADVHLVARALRGTSKCMTVGCTRAGKFFISHLDAMIMGLFAIVTASLISVRTVVAGRVPHETVLQALVSLFVPLEVSDHLLFLHEHPRVAVETMEMLPVNKDHSVSRTASALGWSPRAVPVVQVSASGRPAFLTAAEPPHVTRVIAAGRRRTAAAASGRGRRPLQHHGDVVQGRGDRRLLAGLGPGRGGQRQRAQRPSRCSVVWRGGKKKEQNCKKK